MEQARDGRPVPPVKLCTTVTPSLLTPLLTLLPVPPQKDPAGTMYDVKYEDDNRVRARCVGY